MKDGQLDLRTSPSFRLLLSEFTEITEGHRSAAIYLGVALGGAFFGALLEYRGDFPEFWQTFCHRMARNYELIQEEVKGAETVGERLRTFKGELDGRP